MVENDFESFAEGFGAAWDFHKPLSDRALAKAFQVLARYPLPLVLAAIDAHCADRERGQFPPKPADLIDQIERRNQSQMRPGADEAWLMTPPEESSYWATDEMLGAWAVVAEEMQSERPDKIAARMAFKDAYTRLVDAAKAQGRPVRWQLVRGTRKDNLEDVIREGARLGYVPKSEADDLLRLECDSAKPASMVPLLEGAAASPSPTARESLAALKAFLHRQPAPVYDLDAIRAECEAKDRAKEYRKGRGAA